MVNWEHYEVVYARLASWKDRSPDFVAPHPYTEDDLDLQHTNFKPSDDDNRGLKKLYGWLDPN
jgi:hypothetical protein